VLAAYSRVCRSRALVPLSRAPALLTAPVESRAMLRYAEGTVLRTWNERNGVGVRLSELAAVPGLTSVVASTFSVRSAF